MHALIERDHACATTVVQQGRLSDHAPSPGLLAMLGVLTRPADAQDAFRRH